MDLENANPVQTPMDHNVKLSKLTEDDPRNDYIARNYPAAIGMLIWAAISTRPDISFAVQYLSQFLSHPGPEHWTAVKRVFRYLKGTLNLGLRYTPSEFESLKIIRVFSDADWGNNPDDRRSISGYVTILAGGPITWSSKKQPTVVLSSMEAEYMALCQASREIIWLLRQMTPSCKQLRPASIRHMTLVSRTYIMYTCSQTPQTRSVVVWTRLITPANLPPLLFVGFLCLGSSSMQTTLSTFTTSPLVWSWRTTFSCTSTPPRLALRQVVNPLSLPTSRDAKRSHTCFQDGTLCSG
jgi:hypothetical protein